MDGVKEAGGKTYMFSSLHPSGQQLNNVLFISLSYSVVNRNCSYFAISYGGSV